MSRPDLSIVIIEWNTIELLRDCLRSVFDNCSGISVEVIVVDNASADGSPDMVEAEFPMVKQIRNDDNRGFAAANNQGFKICTGRHILLLNSDTYVLDDVLARTVDYLDRNPDIGAMGCRVLNPDMTMQRTCSMWPRLTDLVFMSSGLWKLRWPKFLGRYQITHWQRDTERDVEVISGCYLALREEVLRQVGPLDEDFFFFGEETDWCRRMKRAGWRLTFAPVGEIVHYGSASARKLNHKRDLMLTDATIRLHRKHSGILAGATAWAILFGFNLSRAAFWSIRSASRDQKASGRARHFLNVVSGMVKIQV